MGLPRIGFRMLPFFRATLDPAALAGTGAEGTPMVAACDSKGILFVHPLASVPSASVAGGGLATSNPGAGVVASASLAGVVGRKWNAVSLSWSYGDTAAAGLRTLVLRDGASGAGAIIWQTNIGPLVAGDSQSGSIVWPAGTGPGNAANGSAFTLEFTAAPAGSGLQSVSLVAYRGT